MNVLLFGDENGKLEVDMDFDERTAATRLRH